jgi:hypothetical protein
VTQRALRALQYLALVLAASVSQAPYAAPPASQAAASTSGPAWSALTPAQQQALAPLRPTWDANDAPRKLKWIEVADRFPKMPADERRRVQERMAAWAAMTPSERARARVQFQETRGLGAEERQARWQAYQALSEDERKRLAQVAKKPAAPTASAAAVRSAAAAAGPTSGSSAKRNVVATSPGPAPRAVAPTVVQAKPGVTTTTVATQAKPPMHHQPGLPKIVSTPNFVDPATLLPRRGPQAAAMRAAASSDPTRQP